MDDVAEVRAAEHHGKRAEDLRALRGDDPRHHRKHTDGAEGNDERHHALDDRIERGDQVLGKLALFARGKDAAAYAAEQYAGTTAVDSVTAEVDPELDESPAHYEVELQTAWGEFEYLVDAYTGKVLSGQKDLLAAVSASNETTKPSGQKPAPSGTVQDIGYAKAKSIALNHAGLSENQAYDMDIELDDEDGTLVYEIEFKSGNMEYDYEIDAASGAILKHEAELED